MSSKFTKKVVKTTRFLIFPNNGITNASSIQVLFIIYDVKISLRTQNLNRKKNAFPYWDRPIVQSSYISVVQNLFEFRIETKAESKNA